MKQQTILTLFVLLFTLFSCSSETATQETNTDNTEQGSGTTAPSTTTSSNTEASTVAVSQVENASDNAKNKEEIELINGEIMRINENLANYTKKESTADWETLACQLIQYKNENGVVVKIESVCGDHSWEMYSVALSETDSKLIYGKHLEKVPDAARPTVREFYSIGSMIPSENAYTVILDESGNELAPAGYRKYSVLYEAAFDAFL
jgi:hypothetical protein